VLVLLGLLVAFSIVKSPASKEGCIIGGALVLRFHSRMATLSERDAICRPRRSLETVITELTVLKARAKEDAVIQRAQAEQLKSLEVEVTRVRAEAAEARRRRAPEGSKDRLEVTPTIGPASRCAGMVPAQRTGPMAYRPYS